ncbi:hypothetical protein AZF37_03900 [endosymbiont 'TC1' of Trimyema compressum]|uniref:DNA-processing protein DprA n=1 Tax=endosymbiont 'TC1' of Trimyema compressum TaxID=243899 RepID=UPI0007F14A43|nr:DNA-processing protein DprA [endosymbiont 'TC1' of Trimyema compressum]AMP20426.1 hypothetical protein AZF37_03900 [endosymbiont 'TC1' of Trimyema compressum]
MIEDKLRSMIAEEIMFAKEAAEYLGISVQRLNKLVHKEELIPVRKSPSGTLFMKRDLDERKYLIATIGKEILLTALQPTLKINSPTLQEAVNYFTIQSYYDYAYKKTETNYAFITEKRDMINVPLTHYSEELAVYLGTDEDELGERYRATVRSFEKLMLTDQVINRTDEAYPFELKRLDSSPLFLFLRGNIKLLDTPIVSLIGTKNPTQEEKMLAYQITKFLGEDGYSIATGLSRGVDTVVMETAHSNKIPSIGVIGTPLNKAYPRENEALQKEVSAMGNGLILSQFSPAAPVKSWHFPIRGMVLSGISQMTVVVDVSLNEGDYKQIEYCLKQGRLVFFPFPRKGTKNSDWADKYLMKKGVVLYKDYEDFVKQFNLVVNG